MTSTEEAITPPPGDPGAAHDIEQVQRRTVRTLLTSQMCGGIGLVSGYIGGRLDTLLMRLVDVVLSMPFLLIAIPEDGSYPPNLLVVPCQKPYPLLDQNHFRPSILLRQSGGESAKKTH